MIGTPAYSADLRQRSVDTDGRRLLVSRLAGSAQEGDLTEPVNCSGLGRVRHFGRPTPAPWPSNPLPAVPAAARLPADGTVPVRAQVFQNASCNWRCWYCYVPFALLGAHTSHSEWRTADELVGLWRDEPDPLQVLDLSGRQPDLVPEWVPWTMRALLDRGLDRSTYLWSDDNLSTDYFWRYLSDDDIALVGDYPNYGRAVCFKGADEESFVLNTAAPADAWDAQFGFAGRLLDARVDLYCYATLTTAAAVADIPGQVARFVDRLQGVHENLPLRTVPLQVQVFRPVEPRLREVHAVALTRQTTAVEAWTEEIARRFPTELRDLPVTDVPLAHG